MKKIVGHHSEDLKPVKLYLDDLEEIIDILEAGSCKNITIQVGDIQLDSLNEIKELVTL